MPYPLIKFGVFLNQRKQFIQIADTEKYKRARVQLHWNGIVLRDEVDGALIKTKNQQVARQGELLVAEIDAKVGGVGIVPPELDGAIVSSHYFLFEIDEAKCLRPWLDWFIRSGGLGDQFAARGSTNYAAIRPHHILNCEIPLPPLDEQSRIVSHVGEMLGKIGVARKLREDAVLAASVFVTSLHINLSGSNVLRIGDILRLDERRIPVRPNSSYPQIGIRGFGQGLFARGTLEGTETTYREFNHLFQGAIVLSQVKGWEGAIAVCGPEFVGWYASPEYRTFSCVADKVLPDYLSVLVSTSWFWQKLSTLTRGVGARRERTRPEAFLELEIPMAGIQQQRYALTLLQKLQRANDIQNETMAELNALVPSILSKAFRGELKYA